MDSIAQQYATSMIDIVTPVFERSILIACEYCKATGRETLTPEDVEYATKYCAMNVVGNHIGSFFPEVYDEEDDRRLTGRSVVTMTALPSSDTQGMNRNS